MENNLAENENRLRVRVEQSISVQEENSSTIIIENKEEKGQQYSTSFNHIEYIMNDVQRRTSIVSGR